MPIIQHEDVRRMLMDLKAGTEAMRAMLSYLYYNSDVAGSTRTKQVRHEASRIVDLCTPLAKAYCSESAFTLTSEAIQVMGGVGYCSEFPAEQYARDIKSAAIYEGTTYIQALDLVGRKLAMDGGTVFQGWLKATRDLADQNVADSDFAQDYELLKRAVDVVADFAERFMKYFTEGQPKLIPLAATRFLECFSETLMARLMLDQGMTGKGKIEWRGTGFVFRRVLSRQD